MIVEVVAREVGECRRVEAHSRDALLIERMRGHLHAERLRAGITRLGKTTCAYLLAQAADLLGRRGAYLGTLGSGRPQIGGLGQQIGAGRLAVRSGERRDAKVRGRRAEEAVRERAGLASESFNRHDDSPRRQCRWLDTRCRLPQHCDRAARDGICGVRESVRGAPGTGQEGRARRDATAVEFDVAQLDVPRRCGDAFKQRDQRRAVLRRPG